MSVKGIYTSVKKALIHSPARLEVFKTSIAEDVAIFRKRNIYRSIHWTKEQQEEFDLFWVKSFGKKIPNKWHRLYQACSGSYAIDYVPEKMYTTIIEPKMNDASYALALEDKAMVELLSYGCGCSVPKTMVLCSGGQLYDENRQPISYDKAISILLNRSFLVKPTTDSSSGRGIEIYKANETNDVEHVSQILRTHGRDYIVQAVINQHPMFAALNESSVNTIRITTFLVNDEIHHAPLSLRMGRSGNNVDNIHAGGLVIGVSDDGQLLPSAYELGYGDKTTKYASHPDSGIIFSNYKLPGIERIIRSAHLVHGRYPHIGIISWDYTVDEESQPVLIEANIMGQSVWIVQMIHGKGLFGKYTAAILNKISG